MTNNEKVVRAKISELYDCLKNKDGSKIEDAQDVTAISLRMLSAMLNGVDIHKLSKDEFIECCLWECDK